MKRHHKYPMEHLATAYEHARGLRIAVQRLLDAVPDAHESWLDLACDVEAIERLLQCAVGEMEEILQHDPAPRTHMHLSGVLEPETCSRSASKYHEKLRTVGTP